MPLFALLLDLSPSDRSVWLVTLFAFLVSGVLIFCARPPRHPEAGKEAPALSAGAVP